MIKSSWPLALTNIMLMLFFNIDPVIASDGTCSCGCCEHCNATIALLDHKLDVIGLKTRGMLTNVSTGFAKRAKNAEECIYTNSSAWLANQPNLFRYAPLWAILPTIWW